MFLAFGPLADILISVIVAPIKLRFAATIVREVRAEMKNEPSARSHRSR